MSQTKQVVFMYLGTHTPTINEEGGQEFERELEGVHLKIWIEGREMM